MRDELEVLVRRLRSGIEPDENGRRLAEALRPRLLRYYLACGVAGADAEDLVQEALIRVFRHVGSLRAEERFVPWLFVLARNVARSAYRRSGQVVDAAELDRLEGTGEPEATAGVEARRRLEVVERALRALPEQQRRCLLLVARDGWSYREVAELLAVSPLTVRNHLAEARRRLRRLLKEEESER